MSAALECLNESRAVDLVMEMMAIPGKSGDEARIAGFIVDKLKAAGVPVSAIEQDTANRRSPIGGACGNLIVKLPGARREPRRLLMGHIDTVPLCVGSQPKRNGEWIKSADPTTALGGDNRAGAAVVLNTVLTMLKHNLPSPPLTIFFPVQEEVGLVGARYATVSKLAKPKLCFNWDGGAPNVPVIGATGADHLEIEIEGLASHAGAHPEDGVSAAVIAARAIADLTAGGWHGLVCKGRKLGTSNIGSLRGGEATNVVLDKLAIRGEARSHDPKFRARIVSEYRKAFEGAAKATKSVSGRSGKVTFVAHDRYESFELSEKEPCVQAAVSAIRAVGLDPQTRSCNGGLDANWMTAHGFPTVTLGCGQDGIHTVKESLHIESFLNACRIGLLLGTGTESDFCPA